MELALVPRLAAQQLAHLALELLDLDLPAGVTLASATFLPRRRTFSRHVRLTKLRQAGTAQAAANTATMTPNTMSPAMPPEPPDPPP
jgi:hypothetical protein